MCSEKDENYPFVMLAIWAVIYTILFGIIKSIEFLSNADPSAKHKEPVIYIIMAVSLVLAFFVKHFLTKLAKRRKK